MGVGCQPHAPAASFPEKDPVPILQEAGWAPGPVWTCGKSHPHRDSISDRPARSSVAIPTELPGPHGGSEGEILSQNTDLSAYYLSV